MKYLLPAILALFCYGCLPITKEDEKKQEKTKAEKDGVRKTFYSNGKLRSEVPIKNGKKNGLAKDFYSDGTPHFEINYVDNVKQGITRMYYQNGKLYEETPYEKDKIHGVKKRYRQDGKLSTEAPYHLGEPCIGLKEYLTDGSPKTKYPTIVVTAINNLLREDRYILRLNMSDNAKNVTFYTGKLEDGCINSSLEQIYQTPKKGVSEISIYLPPGAFLMEEINIVAKVKTALGNYYVTQRKYNVAIENR